MDVANIPYVTLSHCWGKALTARLLTKLVKEYSLNIPWESLILTFQDAIVASLKLGIHYIWIDALCIIQDDKDDWIFEAARMTGVYLNSYLNISADASRDGTEGLFRQRDPHTLQSFVVPHGKGDSQRCGSVFYTDRWFGSVFLSPLAGRAWTVQEKFLAPRVLHFAAEEVLWECMELFTAESLPTLFNTIPESNIIIRKSALRHDLPEQDRAQVLYDIWYQPVTAYSRGTLTFTSDHAIAIAGLAGIFCRLLGLSESDYLCGIWRPQLHCDLMWRRDGSRWTTQDIKAAGLPSWSWLSICAPIWIYSGWSWGDRDDDDLITAEVVHASITRSQIAFGPLSSGTVVLQAFLCQSIIHRGNHADYDPFDDLNRHSMDVDGSILHEHQHFRIYVDDYTVAITDRPVYLMLGRARRPESDPSVAHLGGHPR